LPIRADPPGKSPLASCFLILIEIDELSSAHIVLKQAEMDGVVQQIYKAIEHKPHLKNTLFVLLGDHGMTELGNHGGDSPSEVASALTLISPRFKSISKGLESPVKATNNYEYHSVINQVDLVPTLAGLLGFTIPVRSVGIIVPQFLDLFRGCNYRPQFLFENAQQIMTLFESEYDITAINSDSCSHHCEGCLSDKSQLVCLWTKARQAKLEWEAAQNASTEEMYQVTRTVSLLDTLLLHTSKLVEAIRNVNYNAVL
jgi:ethanolamine phosphate transferase 2 subunit G